MKTSLYRRTVEGIGLCTRWLGTGTSVCAEHGRDRDGIEEIEASVSWIFRNDCHSGRAGARTQGVDCDGGEDTSGDLPQFQLRDSGRRLRRIGARPSQRYDRFHFGALREPSHFDDLHGEGLFESTIGSYAGEIIRSRIARPRPSNLKEYDWVFPIAALPRRDVLKTS